MRSRLQRSRPVTRLDWILSAIGVLGAVLIVWAWMALSQKDALAITFACGVAWYWYRHAI